jgi:hypothetical protein
VNAVRYTVSTADRLPDDSLVETLLMTLAPTTESAVAHDIAVLLRGFELSLRARTEKRAHRELAGEAPTS